MNSNSNILNNYITCPLCNNIFLKNLVRTHYESCKKKNEYKNEQNQKHEHRQEHRNEQRQEHRNEHRQEHRNEQRQEDRNEQNQKNEQRKKYENFQIENYIKPELVSYNDTVLNHFFKEYDKLFSTYVSDKCIALVGPAESILNTGKGSIIDHFDLVVRLNKSIPLPSKLKDDIGTKTDIVYNSFNTSDFPGQNNLNPKLYQKYGVNFVCSSYPFNHNIFHDDIYNYAYKYKFELPLKVMNDLKFKNFERILGTRPYTGTCAIMDLLSYPIKFLYITGLDFYQTKYYSEYRKITKEEFL